MRLLTSAPRFMVLALAATLTVASSAAPTVVEAQPTMPDQIDATPKGTIGLGIMGAELGFAVPALAGLHDAWAFVVFPLIGAGGGAVAGYFLIDNKDNEKAAVGVLAASMALVIPTLVLTLAMTAYDPEDEGVVRGDEDAADDAADEGDGSEDVAEPQEESARDIRMRQRVAAARAGAGLFRLSPRGLQLGVPGFEFGAVFSERDAWINGQQRTQFQVSLFTGSF